MEIENWKYFYCMIIARVSPYSLSWDDAEEQCKTEGAHLAYIPSLAVRTFSWFSNFYY
jgi:hypothetical protein